MSISEEPGARQRSGRAGEPFGRRPHPGVTVAIAITLLVLDLAVPERELERSWHAILHQWRAYLAYVTSFATIGGIWLTHQSIFPRIRYVDSAPR